jgi:hypothetical protein
MTMLVMSYFSFLQQLSAVKQISERLRFASFLRASRHLAKASNVKIAATIKFRTRWAGCLNSDKLSGVTSRFEE